MTLTQGTSLWAIQQMLEGKKVSASSWFNTDYIYLTNSKITDKAGETFEFKDFFNGQVITWQLWTPPNPHTKGTFAWAWEEIQRGNRVKVYEPAYNEDSTFSFWQDKGLLMVSKYNSFSFTDPCDTISVTLINSTKWELA